jgi:hypothetical protein
MQALLADGWDDTVAELRETAARLA